MALDRVPVTALPYSDVYGFLQTVASLVASTERPKYAHLPDGETEYEGALSAIKYQLANAMWSTLNNYTLGEPSWTELEVRLSGTPDHYYRIEAQGGPIGCKRGRNRIPIAEALNRQVCQRHRGGHVTGARSPSGGPDLIITCLQPGDFFLQFRSFNALPIFFH